MDADPCLDEEVARLRARIRAGLHDGPTAGCAPGRMQANLVILPEAGATRFLAFCEANPKPCPLLAVSAPGDPRVPELGPGIDLRSDLPGYRIWRDGVLTGETGDVSDLWRDDLVAFALGCSFGFEAAVPFVGAMAAMVAILAAFPGLATWLPTILMR